jgi:hypothetical protein
LTVAETQDYLRCGRTKLYEVIDQLTIRKLGRKTLVLRASADEFLAALPASKSKPQSAKIRLNPSLALRGLDRRRVPSA